MKNDLLGFVNLILLAITRDSLEAFCLVYVNQDKVLLLIILFRRLFFLWMYKCKILN